MDGCTSVQSYNETDVVGRSPLRFVKSSMKGVFKIYQSCVIKEKVY